MRQGFKMEEYFRLSQGSGSLCIGNDTYLNQVLEEEKGFLSGEGTGEGFPNAVKNRIQVEKV